VTSTTEHLRRALASDPARPRLTYYDDATGERVELSATTLATWVTKTVNLLTLSLDVEEGASVSLHLPRHWLAAVWVLAADAVGARVTRDPADITVADPSALSHPALGQPALGQLGERPAATPGELLVVSLAPMAMPLRPAELEVVHERLPHAQDYVAEVRAMPDQLVPPTPPPGALGDRAESVAAALGLNRQERLAAVGPDWVDSDWADSGAAEPWVEDLLAPLAVDGSVLWVRNPDPAGCVRRWETEQVTAVTGTLPDGVVVPEAIRWLG
jgi:uncharacterized protein (TIGR03089 family)